MKYLAEDIIKESIKDFKADQSRKRRHHVEKMINYYMGQNTDQYIDQYFSADTFREVPLYKINVTKKFIDKLAGVYRNAPRRKIGGIYDNPRYESLVHKKNLRLKHIERMTRLLDVIALNVSFDEATEKIHYQPIYYFDAYFDQLNPKEPVAVVYPMLQPTDDVSYADDVMFCYFDAERKVIYDSDGNILEEIPHSYGVLPFVFPRRIEQIDDFFGEGAIDVVSVNEHINITMTELQLGLRFQMFGQPFATGVYEDTPIARTGSDTIINLPEGANFGIASPSAKIKEVIDSIKFQVEMLAMTNHLSVSFDSNQDRPSSGLALIIKDHDRIEYYKDDVELFRDFEHNLYNLERTIADTNGIYLPDDFSIDFNEPNYPVSMQEQIAKDTWDLERNLTTLPEIMMRYKKDITMEDAKVLMQKNEEINGINRATDTTVS
tara:strand:+ start:4214 stop:5518 length:1305 start_codon:yes stop_codon:yes gene_type:complete